MTRNDYSKSQAAKDRAYIESWNSAEAKAWLDSLSLADRRRLDAEGLLQPILDKVRSSGSATLDRDVADSSLASEEVDFAAAVDGPEEIDESAEKSVESAIYRALEAVCSSGGGGYTPAAEKPAGEALAGAQRASQKEVEETLWDLLRRVVGELLSAPNRSLTVECLALVSGLSYTGDSMTEIARRHRVGRAAVSKRCVELTERLGLPPSRAMRSLTARRAYRHAQLRLRNSKPQ
jgi:hypothetical protein